MGVPARPLCYCGRPVEEDALPQRAILSGDCHSAAFTRLYRCSVWAIIEGPDRILCTIHQFLVQQCIIASTKGIIF